MLVSFLGKLNRKYNEIHTVFKHLQAFDRRLNFAVLQNELLKSSIYSVEPLCRPKDYKETELIVSFTTYSKRIYDAHLVVESIGRQVIKPHRIILWLDKEEFSLENLPEILKKQVHRGLEIEFCNNIRSYKKLIPTLRLNPEANIITIDDDILYPFDMIDRFIKEHKVDRKQVLCNRGHKITKNNDGSIAKYGDWEQEIKSESAGYDIFPTGVGGVFYPAGVFHKEILDEEIFMGIAPSADDIWFKFMTMLTGTKCKIIKREHNFDDEFLSILRSQDIALYHENVFDDK